MLVATRLPLAPKYLFDFDNANFALAIERFDPARHQPQPPGYPLFVLLLKIVHLVVQPVEYTELTAGLIGSLAALVMLWLLGREMFGGRAAWIAPALLLLNPLFLMAGIADEVRVFLAAGAAAVAYFVWRGSLKSAAIAYGIASGFRPDLAAVLAPLMLFPLIVREKRLRDYIVPGLLAVLTIAPWFFDTASRMGGVLSMMRTNAELSRANIHGESIWYGGLTSAGIAIFLLAGYCNALCVVPWMWALPFAWRNGWRPAPRPMVFLLLWFLPAFLLSAIVHIAVPDHALASGTALCVAGAWVLSTLRPQAALAAVALSFVLFVLPPKHLGREPSLPWIRARAAATEKVIDFVRRQPAPRAIVLHDSPVTYRVLSYYFPQDWVVNAAGAEGRVAHANSLMPAGFTPPPVRATIRVDGGRISAATNGE